jgi:hypothetical protein
MRSICLLFCCVLSAVLLIHGVLRVFVVLTRSGLYGRVCVAAVHAWRMWPQKLLQHMLYERIAAVPQPHPTAHGSHFTSQCTDSALASVKWQHCISRFHGLHFNDRCAACTGFDCCARRVDCVAVRSAHFAGVVMVVETSSSCGGLTCLFVRWGQLWSGAHDRLTPEAIKKALDKRDAKCVFVFCF